MRKYARVYTQTAGSLYGSVRTLSFCLEKKKQYIMYILKTKKDPGTTRPGVEFRVQTRTPHPVRNDGGKRKIRFFFFFFVYAHIDSHSARARGNCADFIPV